MPRRLLAFVLLVTATGSAAAQSAANGALALELPAAPRALALGNTGVALAGDETAVFYNPAQLGGVRRAAAGLSTQAYIAASSLHAVAVALPLGRGTLGLGLQALDYGDEEEYRCGNPADCQYGEPTGNEISATDGALTVGYGLAMGRLRVGAAAKLAYQSVASQSAAAVAADLGLGLDLTRWLSIGASLRNVGSRLGFDDRDVPLPRIARVGLAVPVRLGPGLALTATSELVSRRSGRARVAGGVETAWQVAQRMTVHGRLGVVAREPRETVRPVTAGAGVSVGNWTLDYAYQGFDGAIDESHHRFGLRWARRF